jgi:hypothetical protein
LALSLSFHSSCVIRKDLAGGRDLAPWEHGPGVVLLERPDLVLEGGCPCWRGECLLKRVGLSVGEAGGDKHVGASTFGRTGRLHTLLPLDPWGRRWRERSRCRWDVEIKVRLGLLLRLRLRLRLRLLKRGLLLCRLSVVDLDFEHLRATSRALSNRDVQAGDDAVAVGHEDLA